MKFEGQKYFQNPKKDKKNVQFSKMEILYEKRVKFPPLLALWSEKLKKIEKKHDAEF